MNKLLLLAVAALTLSLIACQDSAVAPKEHRVSTDTMAGWYGYVICPASEPVEGAEVTAHCLDCEVLIDVYYVSESDGWFDITSDYAYDEHLACSVCVDATHPEHEYYHCGHDHTPPAPPQRHDINMVHL